MIGSLLGRIGLVAVLAALAVVPSARAAGGPLATATAAAQPPPPPLAGITVGSPITVSGAIPLFGIACESATTCVAVGQNTARTAGVVVPIIDGTPGTLNTVPGVGSLAGVACESATSCVAVGRSSVVPIDDGIPGSPVTVPGVGALTGVACQSASSCVAVGVAGSGAQTEGIVLPITSGTPGTPVPASGTGDFDAVTSEGTSNCVAVGSASGVPAVVSIVDGTPGAPAAVAGGGASGTIETFEGVACQASTSCLGVGFNANGTGATRTAGVLVPITGGPPSSIFTLTATGHTFNAIGCESRNCVAVGGNPDGDQGVVVPVVLPIGSAPGSTIGVPGTSLLQGVACPSATGCEAVGQNAAATAAVVLSISMCPDAAGAFNQGFNPGFNAGFNAAFNAGFNAGFSAATSARIGPGHPRFGRSADVALARADSVSRQALSPACDQLFNEGFNGGFNPGFQTAFNVGFNQGFYWAWCGFGCRVTRISSRIPQGMRLLARRRSPQVSRVTGRFQSQTSRVRRITG